jgi:hypothetical protein
MPLSSGRVGHRRNSAASRAEPVDGMTGDAGFDRVPVVAQVRTRTTALPSAGRRAIWFIV